MRYVGITFVLLALFSCEHPIEPTPPTVDSVIISPSEAELFVGDTLQFNAIVEGTGEFDSTVTWNTIYGVITRSGFYTAPDTVPPDSQVTIRAESVADTTKSGSATVNITEDEPEPIIVSVTVSPSSVQVLVSENLQFDVSVEGTGDFDSTVTWYVNNVVSGNTTYGIITQGGFYTAPDTMPPDSQVTVRAMSVVNFTKHGSAIVRIREKESEWTITSVTVSPQDTTIHVSQALQFTAEVTGTGDFSSEVAWSVTYGTITTNGLYTAPLSVPPELLSVVRAVSVDDSTKCNSVIVEIFAIDSVIVSPQPDSIFVGYEEQFSATVHGTGNFPTDVMWSIHGVEDGSKRYVYIPGVGIILTEPDSERCGYIDQNGRYTAPPTVPFTGTILHGEAEEIIVKGVSIADPSKHDSVSFTITSGISALGINPVVLMIEPSDTVQFNVIYYGNPVDSTIIWFVGNPWGDVYEGGNEQLGFITTTGLYIAPPAIPASFVQIKAQSAADLRKIARAVATF